VPGPGQDLAIGSRVPESSEDLLLWAYSRLLLQALPCLWPYVRIRWSAARVFCSVEGGVDSRMAAPHV